MDVDKLAKDLQKRLPKYARPLFIRLISELQLTGTYKLVKRDLQTEGYNVNKVSDPIYFMGPNDKTYKKLDGDLYRQIQANVMGAKL